MSQQPYFYVLEMSHQKNIKEGRGREVGGTLDNVYIAQTETV